MADTGVQLRRLRSRPGAGTGAAVDQSHPLSSRQRGHDDRSVRRSGLGRIPQTARHCRRRLEAVRRGAKRSPWRELQFRRAPKATGGATGGSHTTFASCFRASSRRDVLETDQGELGGRMDVRSSGASIQSLGRSHRALPRGDASGESAFAEDLREGEVDRLRRDARCLAGCLCLGRSAPAEGSQARRASSGRGLPAWLGRRAGGHDHRRHQVVELRLLQGVLGEAGGARLHRLCSAQPVSRRGQVPHAPAQGEPDGPFALLRDHRAARSHSGLAFGAAVRRSEAHRVLWAELRRQDGDARTGVARSLLSFDLLGRLQRVGDEVRDRGFALQLPLHDRVRHV